MGTSRDANEVPNETSLKARIIDTLFLANSGDTVTISVDCKRPSRFIKEPSFSVKAFPGKIKLASLSPETLKAVCKTVKQLSGNSDMYFSGLSTPTPKKNDAFTNVLCVLLSTPLNWLPTKQAVCGKILNPNHSSDTSFVEFCKESRLVLIALASDLFKILSPKTTKGFFAFMNSLQKGCFPSKKENKLLVEFPKLLLSYVKFSVRPNDATVNNPPVFLFFNRTL